MASVHEQLSRQFHAWEQRGRGWQVYRKPVVPEPPFRPFDGHYLPDTPAIDDGRRPGFLVSLFQRFGGRLNDPPPTPPVIEDEEPEPERLSREDLIELETSLPAKLDISREAFEQFLLNLSRCREPIAFELVGVTDRVTVQFAACQEDLPQVQRQLQAHFSEADFIPRESLLEQTWNDCDGKEALVVEFGLAREFMLPLAAGKLDPFVGIIGALSELKPGEVGLFQVLFQPTSNPWAESIIRSVAHADGKPFFVNAPELTAAAERKVARPLFAAVVRMAVKAPNYDRALQAARDLAASLSVFAHPQGNELIPLENTDYDFEEHVEDALRRQSRRSGMLLNSDELTGFVHLPSSAVRSPVLERDTGKTKAAPAIVRGEKGLLLGANVHAGQSVPVRLTPDHRVRHTHIIGVQGSGKSTLLFNMIRQDIENNEGLAVFDPHGDLIDQILGIIPRHRIDDVVLVDPSDEQYAVGFNILSAHSDLEKNLLASDLVSVFRRLSTSWGDQMNSVLQNAILAFLESEQGGTLSDLRRFLLEPAFRERILQTVHDSEIVYYWRKGFAQLSGNKSIGPVITRLNEFLAPKPIRHMVSQPVNRLDFAHILDSGKIFLAKLPHGQVGRENSFLLGSLLMAKFQQLAMSRQARAVGTRKDFWLYVDEFASFITPSMTEILTGARKYRMGLILAHQELRQLERDREVASAVLSSPCTRIVFRVGDADAKALENGFSSFEARELQNLDIGQAICRVEKADYDFNLAVPLPESVDPHPAEARRQEVIAASRAKYATPRAEVEAALLASLTVEEAGPEPPKPKPVRPPLSKASESKPAEAPRSTTPEAPKVPAVEPKPLVPEIPPSIDPVPAKETVSQSTPTPVEPLEPKDAGRGGVQHKAIQKRLKQAAEELGFLCSPEKDVLDRKGSVDLYLERDGISIACEITITTTTDHEVGNVLKCLKAGSSNVAVIAVDEDRLARIKSGVLGSLGPEAAEKVAYYLPDQFIAHLTALPRKPREPEVRVRKGYRVKSSTSTISAGDQKQQEQAAIRAIAEAMRSPKKA